jgi:hypothetical protein
VNILWAQLNFIVCFLLVILVTLLFRNSFGSVSQAITISTNSWTDAGHAVNQLYDLLYMMGRDDIAVGVGGEGGISYDGIIYPDVGGYFPIIDQVK